MGLNQKDGEGLRLMPGGSRLTLPIDATSDAFENYPDISAMVAEHWKRNLGIKAEVNSLDRNTIAAKKNNNQTLIYIWESSGRDSVLITPQHLLAVSGGANIDVLGGQWFESGGTSGREPISTYIREQQTLYTEGVSTADGDRQLAIARRVVELNCEMVNPVTLVMNKPTYVAIIKRNVRNIPNPLPFSFHAQTPGNGFPETWWLEAAVVNPNADLEVIKTGAPNPVIAGTNLTYTLTVTNKGTTTADHVKITDNLPPGTSLVSATAIGGSCTGSTDITCSFDSLAGGASSTATIIVKVDLDITGPLTNVATTTSDSFDSVLSNNAFKAVTIVKPADPVPSVTPWALVGLALLLFLSFSGRARRAMWRRVGG
jgi:uncharacterized repeat protein (TIGR01451 family)